VTDPTVDPVVAPRPGPLTGLRVVEVASEMAAFAGKLLADLGADVVLVEPPGGHRCRTYEPFVDDVVDPERSLWWWHYQTSKRSVVVDLGDEVGRARFRRLVATADVVLEAEPPGALDARGVDHPDLRARHPRLVWVSVTPFGRTSPRRAEPVTDLTALAGGGPLFLCGYDDHTLPPVRGGGNQAWHTASLWAANATLVAVLERETSGLGQHVDVSVHAALNVTTEVGSYEYLVAGTVVRRQTGRHAHDEPTTPAQHRCGDGRYVYIGFTPGTVAQLRAILDWLDELVLRDEHPEAFWLEVGIERGGVHFSELGQDVEATAIYGAIRAALELIASRLAARAFFVGAAERGLSAGVVASIEEVLDDPHVVARRFPVVVHHDGLGRDVVHPGAPFVMSASPWRISRGAPRLGQHDAELP
jgi:crotonobetainyl-CoA:carnitine CoA-transferase CaiB-like acyl-CoA transferase